MALYFYCASNKNNRDFSREMNRLTERIYKYMKVR
nr:MAG TPA: hypothetical protein [Caudoviricetes sp.]